MAKSISVLVEKAQALTEAILEEIRALDDDSVPEAEITRAKASIAKIQTVIDSIDKSVEDLRGLATAHEEAADSLESAKETLQAAFEELDSLE